MDRRNNGPAIRISLLVLAILVIGGAIAYGGRQIAQAMNSAASNLPSAPSLPPLALPTAGPTATPTIVTSGTVIRQMQAVQRLETTRYTIETVVEANTPDTRFTRGERLLLIAHGTVVVGFDLAKLTTDDVSVSPDGKTVTVNLPPVEIFSSGLDEGKTRIYSRESGKQLAVFPQEADPNLETAARRRGLAQIVQSACEDGIARRATQDGSEAMRDLLTIAGFTAVQVRVKDPATPLCATGSATPRP